MHRLFSFLAAAFLAVSLITSARADVLELHVRSRQLTQDPGGRNRWSVVEGVTQIKPEETAVIVCDVWDKHWSRGASERVEAMAPRINETLKAARAKGMTIIHCPSETMDFYRDSPARRRVQEAPLTPFPPDLPHDDPPQPIDASDGGSDTGEKPWHRAWTRQHAAVEIDQERDGISDNGQEVWNFLSRRRIKNVLILGVHTNMCVLGRPFAIKAMVRRGMNTMLVRDLTDTMYNPARPPYVDHDEGTRLVVEFIEAFWCPTIDSRQLLEAKP